MRMGIRYRVTQGNALTALVAVGLLLRVWQYAANPSLWYDELSIARNLTQLSLRELVTGPLLYTQVAPVGFIAALKITTLIFGTSDLALRLVPLLCGIAGLLLFRRLAVRTLDGTAATISVALFALAPPLIRYSTELKQYGMDVLITVALMLVALDLLDQPTTRRCVIAGLAGFVVIVFSQAAMLVMAGIGAALLVMRRGPVLITVVLWALASILGLVIARHTTTPETIAFMHGFWGVRHGFLPLPPRPTTGIAWMWTRMTQLFTERWMLEYPLPLLYSVLTVLGVVVLWRQRRSLALILVGPFVMTLVAAVAQQYPFHTRVVLFLLPSVLMALAAVIAWVKRPLVMAALLLPPLYTIVTKRPPYVVEAYKPMFAFFQVHRQPGDSVYVFSTTSEAADFYGPRYGLAAGTYYVGICDRKDTRPFIVDMDRFRGTPRLWVLTSGPAPYTWARRTIGRYLGTIGVHTDSIVMPGFEFTPVSADLYNLSDTARLASAEAATFPVDALPDTVHPGCRDLRPPRRSVAPVRNAP
jgi:hypothetical protein